MRTITFIPERLRELRKRDKATQKEFGEKVGCTMASISAYENGSKIPPTPTLIKIAEVCNCSIDWLFGLKDEPEVGNRESSSKTYSDYIKKLFALDDNSVSILLESTPRDLDLDYYSLTFHDIILATFFYAWEKTRALYHDGTIDQTIYQAWKEKVLRDFNVYIINSPEDWNTFHELYNTLRDDKDTSDYDATVEALRLGLPRSFTVDY